MTIDKLPVAQNPLLLRFNRLIDAFAKSDDERDFYLDNVEGFLIYVDLDKPQEEIAALEEELKLHSKRYHVLPKMTFYETKKFMEGFINEKVYDIDTKEKLIDIIQSKEARENFLEFIYDHLTELEKWQQYYMERMRIRIIEWLRLQEVQFVFEEDLELPKALVEKVKKYLFDVKVSKDVAQARDLLLNKSKTYYSDAAIHPRPKRGRPPKHHPKVEIEPQITGDLYTTVIPGVRSFLYLPEISNPSSVTFSARYENQDQLLASLKGGSRVKVDSRLEALSQRLESLRHLSGRLGAIDDIVGEKDKKFIEAVLKHTEPLQDEGKQGSVFNVVQKSLSQKSKKKGDEGSLPRPVSAPRIVTPIVSPKKKT